MNNENVKNNNMDEQSCCCPAKVSLMSAIRGIVNPKDECCPLNSFNTDIERKFIDNVENLCIKIKGKFGNISPSFRKDYENILIVYHLSDLDGHGVKLMNAMMNYHEQI